MMIMPGLALGMVILFVFYFVLFYVFLLQAEKNNSTNLNELAKSSPLYHCSIHSFNNENETEINPADYFVRLFIFTFCLIIR